MLLRFGVANVRSIHRYIEFSFLAATAIKDKGCDLLRWQAGQADVLPIIMIYGANASGKSSLYAAIGMLKRHVTESFTRRQATDGIDRTPFALDCDAAGQPSKLDCDFIVDGVRYHYGFTFDDERYLSEWLHSYPEGYKRVLYERNGTNIEFGKSLRGQNSKLSELMRPNALFLSVSAQGAHAQLTPIYRFFAERIFGQSTTLDDRQTQRDIGTNLDPRLVDLMRSADVGINDMRIAREDGDDSAVEVLMDDNSDKDATRTRTNPPKIQFAHRNNRGENVFFDISQESRGTRRLAALLARILKALDTGALMVIDEIDASLHTLLSSKIMELFSRAASNPRGAQLVAITHDTHLMRSDVLRRDQIWFVEKNAKGESQLFPLTDIRTRNMDNLEKGYLEGRFGAVPYVEGIDLFARVSSGD